MLGTMAGLWISIALGIFCLLMIIGSLGNSESNKIKKDSILYFKLAGVVDERFQPQSLMSILQENESEAPTLQEMLASLRLAQDDNRISALVLDCSGSAMGMASREELLTAIRAFKENSGKPVYAYADTYAQGDYLLATLADSLLVNPMGSVDIHGVGGTTPFFKGTLDKLGVKMQILKVGTFKSAVEPFILNEMSEPARLQMQQYCDTLWAYAAGEISQNRSVPEDTIRALASMIMGARTAAFAKEQGLVDRACYRRNFDNMLADMLDKDSADDLDFVTPAEYLATKDILSEITNGSGSHIAVLYAVGDIVDSGDEGIVGPKMVSQIIELAEDDNVKAMVLRVNSPGGSAFASEQIWEALQYFKSKDKPLYVSMGDYAASGGYYISCGADRIFADRTTITGSIGVFGMIPDFSGLVTDKMGVTFSTVETNPNATGINVMQPMTEEQAEVMQQSVETIYDTFTRRVADGRGMEQDSVKLIAEGRVWVGSSALRLGLVDELGTLNDCIHAIAAEADVNPDKVVSYPKNEEKMWMRMLRESGGLTELRAQSSGMQFDAQTAEYLRLLNRLRAMSPVQARMEPVTIEF